MESTEAAPFVVAAGVVAATSIFWLQYWDLKDRRAPEPRRRLLQAFGLGCASVGLAWALFRAAPWIGLPASPPDEPRKLAAYCVLVAGPVEEGVKFLVARAVCFRWKEFDERIDGLVYAAAVALGFAAVENLVFLRALPWKEGILRAAVSPLTHSLFAAVWGFGTSRALLFVTDPRARWRWQAGTLGAAMVLHGLYDIATLVEGCTPAAAGIIVVLWAFVIWNARRVVKVAAGLRSASGDAR